MNRLTFTVRVNEGDRLAPDAFKSKIGHAYPGYIRGVPIGAGTLIAATVADDGLGAMLTVDLPDVPDVDLRDVVLSSGPMTEWDR